MIFNPVVVASGGGSPETVVGNISAFRSTRTVYYCDGSGEFKQVESSPATSINVLKNSIILIDGSISSQSGGIEFVSTDGYFVTGNFSIQTY